VTGGNRGLGFETCRQLAQLGLTVILSANVANGISRVLRLISLYQNICDSIVK